MTDLTPIQDAEKVAANIEQEAASIITSLPTEGWIIVGTELVESDEFEDSFVIETSVVTHLVPGVYSTQAEATANLPVDTATIRYQVVDAGKIE